MMTKIRDVIFLSMQFRDWGPRYSEEMLEKLIEEADKRFEHKCLPTNSVAKIEMMRKIESFVEEFEKEHFKEVAP